jgi:hypothetical protein
MGKHVPNEDLSPVVNDGSNQAIFVPRDVEHGKFSYPVRRGKRDSQFDKRSIVRFANDYTNGLAESVRRDARERIRSTFSA